MRLVFDVNKPGPSLGVFDDQEEREEEEEGSQPAEGISTEVALDVRPFHSLQPVTDGTYPTPYNYDKKLFGSATLRFQPTAEEIFETAQTMHADVVREQLLAMLFDDDQWFGEICSAAEVTAKSRWLVLPPKGHEDLPTKMLLLRHNSIIVLDKKDPVIRKSNTHDFENPNEAKVWLERTIDQLKKAKYRVL